MPILLFWIQKGLENFQHTIYLLKSWRGEGRIIANLYVLQSMLLICLMYDLDVLVKRSPLKLNQNCHINKHNDDWWSDDPHDDLVIHFQYIYKLSWFFIFSSTKWSLHLNPKFMTRPKYFIKLENETILSFNWMNLIIYLI